MSWNERSILWSLFILLKLHPLEPWKYELFLVVACRLQKSHIQSHSLLPKQSLRAPKIKWDKYDLAPTWVAAWPTKVTVESTLEECVGSLKHYPLILWNLIRLPWSTSKFQYLIFCPNLTPLKTNIRHWVPTDASLMLEISSGVTHRCLTVFLLKTLKFCHSTH